MPPTSILHPGASSVQNHLPKGCKLITTYSMKTITPFVLMKSVIKWAISDSGNTVERSWIICEAVVGHYIISIMSEFALTVRAPQTVQEQAARNTKIYQHKYFGTRKESKWPTIDLLVEGRWTFLWGRWPLHDDDFHHVGMNAHQNAVLFDCMLISTN